MHVKLSRAGAVRVGATLVGLVLSSILAASAAGGLPSTLGQGLQLKPHAVAAPSASAKSAHGQLLNLRANSNQSGNWFGYNQGTLEKGTTLFSSIIGDW